jgi:hypothetical protein
MVAIQPHSHFAYTREPLVQRVRASRERTCVIAVLGLSTTFAFVARDVELVEQSQSRTVVSLRTQLRCNGSGIETYTCTNCETKEYACLGLFEVCDLRNI